MGNSSTFKVIYLGQTDIIDPFEGNFTAENAGALVGRTFDDFSNDSVQTFSPGSYSSYDGSGQASSYQTYNQNNSWGTDWFRITDSSGHTSFHNFDATASFNATITYSDGSVATGQIVIAQDTQGNTWIVPPSAFTPNAALLGAKPIMAITLDSVDTRDSSGLFYWRENIPDLETVPCFAAGTMIATPVGDVPVERLAPGDIALTRDHGPQPIRWVGTSHVPAARLARSAGLRPVRIAAGALGRGVPSADLLVSPQHRILVRSAIAQKMFGAPEVLVAAKQLLQIDGIDIADDLTEVTYYHMLFDRHEVVISNGAETESLFTGPEALRSVGRAARDEILALFPELAAQDYAPVAARVLASGRTGRKLAVRHGQNNKPLVN